MLFDLRGRGRRRTVQVIYVTLALLMGGGLVLFGIGGDVQGGLFDAFSDNSSNDGSGEAKKAVERAEKQAKAKPNDPEAWAALAKASFSYAGTGDGYDQNTQTFTAEGRKRLAIADRAWKRYLELAKKPDPELATLMANAYDQGALNKPEDAVRAYEAVLEAEPKPEYGDYLRLAQLAYAAGQTRKGDLAAQRATELAPKDQKQAVKQAVQQLKSAGAGATGATGSG